MDLITRRVIQQREGEVTDEKLKEYTDPDSQCYKEMVEEIRKQLNFTSLRYHRLDDMIKAIGISPCKLCTYCFVEKNNKKRAACFVLPLLM